ncbi:MAG TPA: hypothetical protein VK982_07350 [Bacteroidales bacterium]|nr:hypothetical protein [Bacteroidales bacterium]
MNHDINTLINKQKLYFDTIQTLVNLKTDILSKQLCKYTIDENGSVQQEIIWNTKCKEYYDELSNIIDYIHNKIFDI